MAAPAQDDTPSPLTGQRIGAVAIALAVILPLLVPGMTGNALNKLSQSGAGDGTGTGNGPLNEFAALKGELRQGQEVTLMNVRTNLTPPPYLRTKVLDRYQSNGFAAATTDARPINAGDQLSPPDHQPGGNEQSYTLEVALTDKYDDDHLPIYYAPTRLDDIGGDWRYDTDKAVIRSDRQQGNFAYTVQGEMPTPTAAELDTAGKPVQDEVPDRLTGLTSTFPDALKKATADVVRGITGPYAQAKAINDYFTDGRNGFSYSETTATGNSGNALLDFLKNKQGYCEQYAAAMATMLRVLDIPSRVAIGYTPGTKNDDGSWKVTNHDAHAWVEAYFSGVGWAYFDPTPLADGRTVAPAYAPRPSASSGPSASTSSGAAGSAGPTANQIPEQDLNPGSSSGGLQNDGLITPRRLLTAAIVLAILVLLLLPAVVRLSSRRRRLRTAAGTDPGAAARAAWDEVVGSAADYGVPVRSSETPRALARRLDHDLSLDTDASRGLRLVALAEERARYAARAGVDGDLPGAIRAVRRGLRGGADRRRRWQAALLPPSTVRAARSGSALRAESASTALNRLGESLRRPVTPRRRR
ncbi:MAG TPA: DUF3488 and transglutaminase-like domain-containing protein [Mycobacteriales bacterium]|nr:DUF3488 and transglutaminase-like domain-containing protein [Mycobacteriales bacterium]